MSSELASRPSRARRHVAQKRRRQRGESLDLRLGARPAPRPVRAPAVGTRRRAEFVRETELVEHVGSRDGDEMRRDPGHGGLLQRRRVPAAQVMQSPQRSSLVVGSSHCKNRTSLGTAPARCTASLQLRPSPRWPMTRNNSDVDLAAGTREREQAVHRLKLAQREPRRRAAAVVPPTRRVEQDIGHPLPVHSTGLFRLWLFDSFVVFLPGPTPRSSFAAAFRSRMALTSAGMSPARAKASKMTPPPRASPSSSSKSTSPDEIPLGDTDAILEASDGGIDPVTARVCSVVRDLATSTHTRASSRRDGDIADCARTPASARGASHDARHLNATTPPRDSSRTTSAAAILTPTEDASSSERNSESVDDAAPRVTNAASVSPGASRPSARFLRVAASVAASALATLFASFPSFAFASSRNAAASAPAVSADVRAASTAAAVTPSATAAHEPRKIRPPRVARRPRDVAVEPRGRGRVLQPDRHRRRRRDVVRVGVRVAVHGNLHVLKRRRRGRATSPSLARLRVRDGRGGFPRAVSAVASRSPPSAPAALGTAVRGRRPAAPRQAARRAVGPRVVQREVLRAPRRSRRRSGRRRGGGDSSSHSCDRSSLAVGRRAGSLRKQAVGSSSSGDIPRSSGGDSSRTMAKSGHRLRSMRRRTGEQLHDDARHRHVALRIRAAAHLDHLQRHQYGVPTTCPRRRRRLRQTFLACSNQAGSRLARPRPSSQRCRSPPAPRRPWSREVGALDVAVDDAVPQRCRYAGVEHTRRTRRAPRARVELLAFIDAASEPASQYSSTM